MKVEVFACNEGLEARIAIEDFDPQEWRARFGSRRELLGHLLANGIAPDRVEDAALESACALLSSDERDPGALALNLREVQSLSLASGLAPQDEEAEGLMFHKTYVTEPAEIESLMRNLKDGGIEGLKRTADPGCLVEAGQVVVSFLSIREGKPGIDVYGKPLQFRSYTHSLPKCGRGLTRLERNAPSPAHPTAAAVRNAGDSCRSRYVPPPTSGRRRSAHSPALGSPRRLDG
jgi:hypothetical protein